MDYDNIEREWREQHNKNIEKWNIQDPRTLLLAIQEELGELTQSVLEYEVEGGRYREIEDEAVDLAALMYGFHLSMQYYEFNHENAQWEVK